MEGFLEIVCLRKQLVEDMMLLKGNHGTGEESHSKNKSDQPEESGHYGILNLISDETANDTGQ
jgi:hypothetical protein